MTGARRDGLLFLVFGCLLFTLGGAGMVSRPQATAIDFKAVYYSARCVLQHCDPYNEAELQRIYQAEGGDTPSDPDYVRRLVTLCVNLPSAYSVYMLFALLPWSVAHALWALCIGLSVMLAAILMWFASAEHAPVLSGVLLCIFLLSSLVLIDVANTAGLVVGLCVISVWCFLRNRFVSAGIICMAISLIIKPHDAGFIWLYFMLIGGEQRRRAVRVLIVAVALALPGTVRVNHVAPNWVSELHANLSVTANRGDVNDPGPMSASRNTPDFIIDLQSLISVFYDNPRVYNLISYLIAFPIIGVWIWAVKRRGGHAGDHWYALAAIAALAMLPVYHRQDDARLMLLAIPAFAILWKRGGARGRWALFFTGAAIVLNGDVLTALRIAPFRHALEASSGAWHMMLNVVVARPVPLVLLVTGLFYLWCYLRADNHERVTSIVTE
ncbi:MAG TPA: glycosyltransferase 87 family protein [Terracidiphilus sp.]|nr:glycosyltransferase 87 family protein [Terracidiphilus sp.]